MPEALGIPLPFSILTWGNASISPVADTRYLAPGHGDGIADGNPMSSYRLPRNAVAQAMYVRHNASAGNGNPVVYMLCKDGVPTALTATLATGAIGNAVDFTHKVLLETGDRIDLIAIKAATIGNSGICVMVALMLTPRS